jgi:hypothetical integral membrane protein (TIGR02206 family)
MGEFRIFGLAHLLAMASIGVIAVGLCLGVRSLKSEKARRWVRGGLGAAVVAMIVLHLVVASQHSPLRILDVVPLHLCDFALLVAVAASWAGWRWAREVTFFWACSATLLAVISPGLAADFPSWQFVSYFALHGVVIWVAVTLVFGLKQPIERGAWIRALVFTNGYAGLVALVNVWQDTNFLFLCAKPDAETLLDVFGPWPWYLVVSEVVAAILFFALQTAVDRTRLNRVAAENGLARP